jgi:hypothetical protein
MSLRTAAAAAILGLAACVAAACDSQTSSAPGAGPGQNPAPAAGASPAGSTAGAAGHASAAQCASASAAVVSRTLKLSVGKVVTSVEGPVTVCAFTGKYEVIVRYQVGESASQFAHDRNSIAHLHQQVASVSGVGNEAYFARYVTSGPTSNTLAARKGAVAVFITSPAQLSAERSLMSVLLARV